MVGSLGVCGRVAAVALLAVSSAVPHSGPVASAAAPAPVADVVTSCSVTVGTATTDPARASDAARALAIGYAATDCMPDATLIAAAEARATITLPSSVPDSGSIVGGAVAGTSSGPEGGSATAASQGTATTASQGTATAASVPSTSAVPTTSAPTTTTAADTTTPSSTGTTTSSSPGTSDTGSSTATTTGSSSPTSDTDSGTVDGGTSGDGDPGDTTPGGTTDGTSTDGTTTAAGRYGWGQATRSEDFDGDLSAWGVYDGPGHAGKGRRSPTAMSVANGIVTISGDSAGTTGGMAWRGGAKYGRWEARVKSPASDPTYNAVMLLWPDAENFPVGGEVDFMEISDETRQNTGFFLHYGESNRQLHGQVAIDATQWHNWAVEWAPDHITAYVDGQEWYTTRDTGAFPPGPMHLTLQLDWFPKGGGAVRPSTMSTDWVRYYPIDGSGASGAVLNSADAGAGSFVGPQVVDGSGSGTGATADSGTGGSGGGTDVNADSSNSVAGVTATSTTAVTRTASAEVAERASGTTGTATASSATTAPATVTTTAVARATVTAGSTDGSSEG